MRSTPRQQTGPVDPRLLAVVWLMLILLGAGSISFQPIDPGLGPQPTPTPGFP